MNWNDMNAVVWDQPTERTELLRNMIRLAKHINRETYVDVLLMEHLCGESLSSLFREVKE